MVFRQRDRAKAAALLRDSLRRTARLRREFDTMRRRYRDALPMLSSREKWESVLLEPTTTGPKDGAK